MRECKPLLKLHDIGLSQGCPSTSNSGVPLNCGMVMAIDQLSFSCYLLPPNIWAQQENNESRAFRIRPGIMLTLERGTLALDFHPR